MKQAAKAKAEREHVAWHRAQADGFRAMAEQGKHYLAEHAEHLDEDDKAKVQAGIDRYEELALEADNAQCLGDHGAGDLASELMGL